MTRTWRKRWLHSWAKARWAMFLAGGSRSFHLDAALRGESSNTEGPYERGRRRALEEAATVVATLLANGVRPLDITAELRTRAAGAHSGFSCCGGNDEHCADCPG